MISRKVDCGISADMIKLAPKMRVKPRNTMVMALYTTLLSTRRFQMITSSRPRSTEATVMISTAKEVIFTPPPVDPGAAR